MMITEFWDEESGGFIFTSNDHEELIVRNKDFKENATPSGNSAAADVLLRLTKIYGDERYERFAGVVLRLAASQVSRYPQAFGRMLSAIEFGVSPVKEVAVIGDRGNPLERFVFETYLPNSVVAISETGGGPLPLLSDKTASEGTALGYVCEKFVCAMPTSSAEEFADQLNSK
jgi:uncharacterized protein YyaL (SSP411 family)